MSALIPVQLRGSRVRLVPMGESHLSALCAIGLDEQLWRLTTIGVRTPADMGNYIEAALVAQRAGTALPFVIEDRATNQLIGSTRFHSYAEPHRRIEIGFTWLAVPSQRTGANTEAKYLMLRHAFEMFGC